MSTPIAASEPEASEPARDNPKRDTIDSASWRSRCAHFARRVRLVRQTCVGPRLAPTAVLFLLALWAWWALAVVAHPLSRTNIDALPSAHAPSGVQRWALLSPRDGKDRFLPVLSDSVRDKWQIYPGLVPQYGTPNASDQSNNTQSNNTVPSNIELAWKDEDGTHIARLHGGNTTVRSTPGFSASTKSDSSTGQRVVTLPDSARVNDVSALWNGNRLIGPTRVGATISVVLALALLMFQPRYRTRWGWFWILGAPMGVGFVWMLLREHWFCAAPAPEGARRPGGWTGLATLIFLSFLATAVFGASSGG